MSKEVSSAEAAPAAKALAQERKSGRLVVVVGGIILFAVIALALGLGLGLGLKHHHSTASSTPPGSSPSVSSSSVSSPLPSPTALSDTALGTVQSWRRSTLDYSLDMNWDLNAPPTTRVYNLTVSEIQAAPDGVVRTLLVFNGQFPGPLIEANRGDRLLINVTNTLQNATTVHWHGLYQNGTNWMDGTSGVTQCPIPPGKSFLYNFTLENQYGTYWYHSHFQTQYSDGLVGPLIIHAPDEASIRVGYDFDQIILLSDWYHDLSASLLPGYLASGNENLEPVPDNGLIQGTNYFNCSSYDPDSGYICQDNSTQASFVVSQNKRYRFRLINTGSFGEFQFSVDNHTLTVIEADSTLVEPVTVHRLPIHIAQRYSVIIHTNQTATNYWIRAWLNTFCFGDDNLPVLNPNVLALLTYTNTTYEPLDTESVDWTTALELQCQDLNVTELVPLVAEDAPSPDQAFRIDVSFQIHDYAIDLAYINSTTWVPLTVPTLNQAITGLHADNATFNNLGLSTAFPSSQFIITVPELQVIDLLINSLDEGAHPFHLHGYQFWIMADGSSGDFDWSTYESLNITNPMRRDTMTIDAYGWAMIRIRADNPGLWALHCHIAWHMEAGLLMQFQIRNDLMKEWTLPSDVAALCNG